MTVLRRLGRLLLGTCLVVAGTGVPAAADARPTAPDATQLTTFLESALRDTGLPGMAAAVVRGDRTVVVGMAVSTARVIALIRTRAAGTRRRTTPTRPRSGEQ